MPFVTATSALKFDLDNLHVLYFIDGSSHVKLFLSGCFTDCSFEIFCS